MVASTDGVNVRSVFRGWGVLNFSGSSSSPESHATEHRANDPPVSETRSYNQHASRISTHADSSDSTKRRGNSTAASEAYNDPSPQGIDDGLIGGKRSGGKSERRVHHGTEGSVAHIKQRYEQNGGGQQPQERSDTDPKQNVEERPKTKRCEKHSRDPELLGRELKNDTKHPSKKTSGRSADPISKPDPEATTQKPKYRTAEEGVSYYCEKCQSLESESSEVHALKGKLNAMNKSLHSSQLEITKLQQSKEKYKTENEILRRKLEEQRIQYSSASEKYQSEIDRQNSKCDALQASHIRAVNNIGTGLEPISDQEFETRFQALHDEVGVWSRKAFKQRSEVRKPEQLDDILLQIITPRVHDHTISSLRLPRLVEIIFWEYIEMNILSVWFPDMGVELMKNMTDLQGWIRAGDKSEGNGRSEYWRAYTISLLFQNSAVQDSLGKYETGPAHIWALIYALQTNSVQLDDKFYAALKDFLCCASKLAAELRCQRGVYEVDNNIRVGDTYDDSTMTDVTFSAADLDDEEENTQKQAFVSCIIAKGVVRRPFPGSTEVEKQLSKARVLVTVN